MLNGYAAFWRKQFSNDLLDDKPYCMGYAWTYLWVMANHKDGFVHFRKETILIKKGQRVTSFMKLGEQFGWDRKKAKRFFIMLNTANMITYKATKRYVIYTVLEYDKHQKTETGGQQTDQQTDHQRTQQGTQQLPINNNGNNGNNENKGGARFSAKRTRPKVGVKKMVTAAHKYAAEQREEAKKNEAN